MDDELQYAELDVVSAPPSGATEDLARVHDVMVDVAVEIGRTRMSIGETLALGPGAVVTVGRLSGEPVDLLVNGKPVARGEVVLIDESYGLRITEVVAGDPLARLGEDAAAA